jgi:hypothetical protein
VSRTPLAACNRHIFVSRGQCCGCALI